MEELHQFEFGTIVCDGCACRIDSHCHDGRLRDVEELLECELDYRGWSKHDKDNWYCPDCAKDPSHRIHPGEGRVIRERGTLLGLRCDKCGAEFEDGEGYSLWEDGDYVEERSHDEEWRKMGGRMLCPDCKETCPAMADEDEENYEEVYCSKCPYKDDCYEEVERVVPEASVLCEHGVRDVDGNYKRCLYLEQGKHIREKCNLPEGKKCPRLEAWEIKRKEVEAKNKEVLEWLNGKGENK